MTDSIARVPFLLPLVAIFWARSFLFALQMVRHLRVFGAVRPTRPFADIPRRLTAEPHWVPWRLWPALSFVESRNWISRDRR